MGNEYFQPPFKFCMQLGTLGECTKCPLQRLQHSCCHGNNGSLFEAWGLIFRQKRRKKIVKCLFIYLKLDTTLQVSWKPRNEQLAQMGSFHQSKRSDNKQYAVEVRWGNFFENLTYFFIPWSGRKYSHTNSYNPAMTVIA